MLLAAIVLAFSLVFGGSTPPPSATPMAAPTSQLPPTQPGLGQDEGVFFVTSADDGSQAVYFIAGNARHSILWTDVQTELQLNPLWPVYSATPDQVLAFPEGGPVGQARTGLLGSAVVAEAPAPAPADEPSTYTLKPGDNLTRIAAQFGVSVEDILAANGLPNANRVEAGQTLVIPIPDATADAPADDSASADATSYTVQPGDSAFKIARRFGIDQGTLLDANGITNPNRVYVGQVLTIPASSS